MNIKSSLIIGTGIMSSNIAIKSLLATCLWLTLLPGTINATVINLVGANAENLNAQIPDSAFASHSQQNASGAEWGPGVGTVTGGVWSGFQTNRSVAVDERLSLGPSDYTYGRTSFTAGAGGQINPANVHSFNLHIEQYNSNGCCGLISRLWGDVTFRFDIPGAPGPIYASSGALTNSPYPIYFVYDWNAEAEGSAGNTYDTNWSGTGENPNDGQWSWSQPNLPHYGNMFDGTVSGGGSGVFYSWTGGDYRFIFPLDVLGSAMWRPSIMDIDIRLAFSDQPFTSIPTTSNNVPEPSTVLLFGTALAGLALARRTSTRLQPIPRHGQKGLNV